MDTVENELFFCLENRRVPRAEMEERLSAALDFCGIAHLRRRPLRSLSGGGEAAGRAGLSGRTAAGLDPAGRALRQFGRPNRRPSLRTARPVPPGMRHRHSGHRPPAGPLAVHRRTRSASWPRTARWTAPPMPPAPLSPQAWAERGVSVPGCPYRPPGRSRPGRRRWCSPCGACGSPRMGARVLRDVNADFFRGRIHVIVGPSGSGKSTLFGALSGLYRYQGSARLEGMELSRHRRRLTGRMGFVTQSPQDQFVADTVLDEVTVSLRHSAGAGDPAAGAEEVLPPDPALALPPPVPLYAQPGPAAAAGGGRPAGLRLPGAGVRRAHLRPGSRAAPPPSWTPSSRRWWSGASPSSCPPTTGHWLRTTPTFSTS